MEELKLNEEEKIRYQITLNLERQLSELGILRYQIITILAGLSVAISGVTLSLPKEVILNKIPWLISLIIFIFITITGLLIYLGQTRDGLDRLETIKENIKHYSLLDMPTSPKPKHFFYWPEILSTFFVIGILFFLLSIINLNCFIK